jgi:ABC-type transport system substrate-binding protein
VNSAKLRPFLTVLVILGLGLQPVMLGSHVSVGSSNPPLRMTLVAPPNSLNQLSAVSANTVYLLTQMEYPSGVWPEILPNGSLDWTHSVMSTITHNQNFTVWQFSLKPNLKWSDGTPINSTDILTTYGPKFGFNSSYDIWGLGPEVQNEHVVNVTTAEYDLNVTDAHFPEKMTGQVWLDLYPASFVNTKGVSDPNFGTDVAAGPFYVSNYASGSTQMTMLPNQYYPTTPPMSALDISFVESESLTTGPLLAGSTDLAPIEPSNAPSIVGHQGLGIIDEKGRGITDIQYNDTMYPYNMTAFRQALVFAINQTQYINLALNGYGVPAYTGEGTVAPNSSIWYNPGVTKYSFNTTTATALLNSIGIKKGTDGYMQFPNGTDITLSLWADTDNTADTLGAGVVKNDYMALGFKVNLQTTSIANIVSDYGSNVQGIRSAMILSSIYAPIWGFALLDVEPAWNVYWLPTVPNIYWEYPPSADAQYQSNLSAWKTTDNITQEKVYVDNIQSLNSQFLPTIVLAYQDDLWGYNTQVWHNWPTNGAITFEANTWNFTALLSLTPSLSTTTTAGSSTSTSTGLTSSLTTNTSSSTSSGISTLEIAAIAIVVIIVVVGAILFLRRR